MEDKQKVMLIVPPRKQPSTSVKRCCTPIGLAYIAAVLEKENISVCILDTLAEGYDNEEEEGDGYINIGLSDEDIKSRIKEFGPSYVGIACAFTSEIGNTAKVAKLVKEVNPYIKVILGGLHPSNYPLETLDFIHEADFIILGEGEYRFPKLVKGERDFDGLVIAENRKVFPATTRIEDIDALPFPARHLLKMDIYIRINKHISPYPKRERTEQILTSRGCPCRCVFCTSSNFWGHVFRRRSPENVIEEMKQLIKEYGIQEFQFTDDTMTLDRERAIKIFELMKPLNVSFCMANGTYVNSLTEETIRKMKEGGCYQITFSIESGNKKSLELMKKNVDLTRVKPLVDYAKRQGISCHATLVVGVPGETLADIKGSFKFVRKCDFDSVSSFILSPLPGSEVYDNCIDKGYLNPVPFEKFDFRTTKINNPDLPPEDVERLMEKETTKFVVRFLFKHPVKFFRKYGMFMIRNPTEIPKVFGRVT